MILDTLLELFVLLFEEGYVLDVVFYDELGG